MSVLKSVRPKTFFATVSVLAVIAAAGGSEAWAVPTSAVASHTTSQQVSTSTSRTVTIHTSEITHASTAVPSSAPRHIAKSAPVQKLGCVENALNLAEPLLNSLSIPGQAPLRGVPEVVAQKPSISPVVTVALAEVPQLRVGQLVQLVELAEPVA